MHVLRTGTLKERVLFRLEDLANALYRSPSSASLFTVVDGFDAEVFGGLA